MAPWQLMGMNYIGPLPETVDGLRYIWHVIDYFSRFSTTVASYTARPEDTVHCLEEATSDAPWSAAE